MSRTGYAEVYLEDVCRDLTVGHVGPMADKYIDAGIPFLRSQDIEPFRLNLDSIKFIDSEFDHKLRKSRLFPGDVVIVRTGYAGTACVVPKSLGTANCADLVVVRPSERIDPWFLVGVLNSAWGKSTVSGNLVGVAQQHFNVGAARKLKIALPPIAAQARIGRAIKSYCDLIENNTRRIAILDEMARRIFEEWFVHFRAPGCEGPPLVESKLGPIPKGWEFVCLPDVAEITYGFPFKSKLFRSDPAGSGVIRIRDILSGATETFTDEQAGARYLVREGDILVGMDGIFHMNIWPGGDAMLNQRVTRLRPKVSHSTTWLFLSVFRPIKHLERTIVGTTVAHLSARELNTLQVVVPPTDIRDAAKKVLDPLSQLTLKLKKQNANLRAQRDLLLPKLISGEIEVADAAPMLEAAE